MNAIAVGTVASLHIHPIRSGEPMLDVNMVELVEGKGIAGNNRYFGRNSSRTNLPSKRQVSLIEREQIMEHARALGLDGIAPGVVRSNIETIGVNLVKYLGSELYIGEALILISIPRDPCFKMDLISHGLKDRMMNNKQGVLAQVLKSGIVRVGDIVALATKNRSPGDLLSI